MSSQIIVINAPPGVLGVDLRGNDATADGSGGGVVVSNVHDDSLLIDQIRVGDLIISIDGVDARGKSVDGKIIALLFAMDLIHWRMPF